MSNEDNVTFIEGTKIGDTFTLLSDLRWHCGRHEFPSSQPAALVRELRNLGYDIETGKNLECEGPCQDRETHWRLKSLEPARPIKMHLPSSAQALLSSKLEELEKLEKRREFLISEINKLEKAASCNRL
ncbi:MAG TPA: hypothetical protein VH186_08365 [Chloroflexia bacterium]|nr:hypothetical protein [Chloroflexia bacterium]